jgi:hypothetical protein
MIVGIIHYYICVLLLQNNLGRFLTEIDLYIYLQFYLRQENILLMI